MIKKICKRTTFIIILLILLGLLCVLVLNLMVTLSTRDNIYTLEEYTSPSTDADCILVLGAGLKDGKPSPMLKDRLDKGIECYQKGYAPKILMSGDHGRSTYNEVQVMKQYAIDAGIPSEDIFMDHAGFSTYDSMIRARHIFKIQTPIVITQRYHLYRAVYIGQKLGLTCTGIETENYSYGGQAKRTLREYLARCKDVFTVLLSKEPTYGGDSIPIDGDGNETNDV